ncbi:hypothetical protein EGT74_14360 [Chitinophaga lutea]|uniref:Uncharacterized protein n=1 Tax=Chitinophaga lutea TaxID=2488634 RepID=A0A3N4PHS4_9BACT|nr:hypothetical protein [Chitinophaga lutea]RPE08243.1 hypothetical protein EGT74_14360 [Chitinophaga lutea]
MSYLLIGNISALICEENIEPLANARIRIYLPSQNYGVEELARGIFKDLRRLSESDVQAKADHLLAESMLDERGNFSISWEDLHLFTEPLEMDICLNSVPGRHTGQQEWVQFHLSTFVPHWKRSKNRYLGAFAYVVPADKWTVIRREFGAWVITGAVKHAETLQGLKTLRVEAYNALNDRLLGWCNTSETGHYRLYFSRKDLSGGRLMQILKNNDDLFSDGPDVYFKVYSGNQLVWHESKDIALQPERQQLKHCAKLNLFIQPAPAEKKPPRLSGWLNDFIQINKTRPHYKDRYVTY